ncbi:MAG TPA: hypothetical protein DCQ98_05410 [Planctomycetaceae bacterium]|nr:hypothetical protein [Planctomycetaceae bacterium]
MTERDVEPSVGSLVSGKAGRGMRSSSWRTEGARGSIMIRARLDPIPASGFGGRDESFGGVRI